MTGKNLIRRLQAMTLSVALAFLLCSCAGSDRAMMEPEARADAYAEFPGQNHVEDVMDTAQRAATTEPEFGSIVQAIGNIAPVSGITVAFEGSNVGGTSDFESVVTIERSDASQLVIDTKDDIHHIVIRSTPDIPLEGYDKLVFRSTVDEITLARVVTLWNAYDVGEWMSGGYWIHGILEAETAELSGSEMGAFIDGPYLSGTESLPESGSATYTGYSAGYYTSDSGSDGVFEEGTLTSGEYTGSLSLTADFGPEAMNISGSVDDIVVSGYAYAPSGTETGFFDVPVDGQILLKSAALSSYGSATGSVSVSGDNVAGSEGVWGVQLSSLPDDFGNPRAAGGTSGAIYTTVGGSEVTFVGSFYGLSTGLSAPSAPGSGN